MARRKDDLQTDKISHEFMARLNRLAPQQKVRAIVILRTEDIGSAPTRRQSHAERQATINAIRRAVQAALPEIDRILERFDGRRLATNVDALGSIPVETTAAGVTALATSEHVKAILEDQAISLPPQPRR